MGNNFIDETGNKYGRLTVIERGGNSLDRQAMWVCQCSCGKIHIVRGTALRRGEVKSCGCLVYEKRKKVAPDLTGKKYGRLTVIGRGENPNDTSAMWLCVCECGNEVVVRGKSLRSGGTKSCGCLLRESARKRNSLSFGEASFNRFKRRIRKASKKHGYDCDMTDTEIREVSQQNCFYCKSFPSHVAKATGGNGDFVYNGFDRVDNTRGYTLNNVVACCRKCNVAKGKMSISEFSIWLNSVWGNRQNWERRNA